MTRHVFEPLAMNDTGFFVDAASVDRFADCYKHEPRGHFALLDPADSSGYLKRPGEDHQFDKKSKRVLQGHEVPREQRLVSAEGGVGEAL